MINPNSMHERHERAYSHNNQSLLFSFNPKDNEIKVEYKENDLKENRKDSVNYIILKEKKQNLLSKLEFKPKLKLTKNLFSIPNSNLNDVIVGTTVGAENSNNNTENKNKIKAITEGQSTISNDKPKSKSHIKKRMIGFSVYETLSSKK